MKTKYILISATISLILLTTSCYKSNNSYNSSSNPSTSKVSISASGYSPSSLSVVLGSTVTWTNNDNAMHTVTTTDGSISSGDIAAGSSYSKTFATAGTYNYFDVHNSNMTGVVIVLTGSGGGGY